MTAFDPTTRAPTAPRLPWDPADPYAFYESRRRAGDVVWDDEAHAWLVLGYEAARSVLRDPGWSSDPLVDPVARAALGPVGAQFAARTMLFTDGATHRHLRGPLRDVFARGFVAGLQTGIDAIVADVVDHPATGEVVDLMAGIALPLPLAVIGEWLDLDPDCSDLLRELSPAIIRTLGALADEADLRAGSEAAAALMAQFLPIAADRRAHPGDDLLSFLATDPTLDLDEVVANTLLLAVAGHETTANVLGSGLVRLLTPAPDGTPPAARFAPDDPGLVSELLRLDAPAQAVVRTATADHDIAGVRVPTGDTVLVVVAAANRDPAEFDDPAAFRPGRGGPAALSFGYGAHHCIGAALAELELSAALPRILARRPRLAGPVTWRDTPAIRGPRAVPVVFEAD